MISSPLTRRQRAQVIDAARRLYDAEKTQFLSTVRSLIFDVDSTPTDQAVQSAIRAAMFTIERSRDADLEWPHR